MENTKEVKLDNVRDLRERLKETLKLCFQGKAEDGQVRQITTTSAQLLKTCASEMDYAKMNRTTAKIDFLEPDAK